MSAVSYTLDELAQRLSVVPYANTGVEITGIAGLSEASSTELSFCRSKKYLKDLKATNAAAVIIAEDILPHYDAAALVSDDPEQTLIDAMHVFYPEKPIDATVHVSAVIAEKCSISSSANIGPNVVIDSGVSIGEQVTISAGCHIGEGVSIGANSCLHSRVVIYSGVSIGERVIIHASSVIGADGFGYHRNGDSGSWSKVPQVGNVIIGDDVEIGASTTIDRATFGATVIGKGVKIDNQVMVAHNVEIGEHTVIAGCTGIAGSAKIGKNCIIAGHCGIADNITLTDNVVISGKATVERSIFKPGIYSSGTGLYAGLSWHRMVVRLRSLEKIMKTIKVLQKSLEKET